MNAFDWDDCLMMSRQVVGSTPEAMIQSMIPGCVSVIKTDKEIDKTGVDYVATLRKGSQIRIDHKTRREGCRCFWKHGEPELCLEKWSVIPDARNPSGVAGWTLSESKATEYTFHTFHPSDSLEVYLLPFQLLRMAFRRHIDEWYRDYDVAPQETWKDGRLVWCSECVMVPVSIVTSAVREAMYAVSDKSGCVDCGPTLWGLDTGGGNGR